MDFCQGIRDYESEIHKEVLVDNDDHVTCNMEAFRDWVQESGLSNASNASDSVGFLVHNADGSQYDDVEQKRYFLSKLHEFYHESEAGIPHRNAHRMDIRPIDGEDEYRLRYFGAVVLSQYDFFSLQSIADREEDNWKEFMRKSAALCHETLGDDHGNLCSPRISSLRSAWSEGKFVF